MLPAEIGPILVTIGVGFIILLLFLKTNILKNLSQKYKTKSGYRYKENPYDKLEKPDLMNIISKTNTSYRIIIIIYGILLAFVVSDKISLALSSWYFIIWSGWILAIMVKAGAVSMALSDIAETRSINEVRNEIYAKKIFFKHSIYLLVLGIAFLPSFFMAPEPALETLEEYKWGIEVSVATSATAIFCSTLFFFFVSFRVSDYITTRGATKLYIFAGLLLVMGAIAYFSAPPLEPIELTLLYKPVSIVPMFFIVLLQFGNVFGFAMMGGLGKVLLDAIHVKSKK